MKMSDFIEHEIAAQGSRLAGLSNSKGREYTGDEDVMASFREQARDLGLCPESVLLVYLNKHLRAIKTYIRDTQAGNRRALSEPIEGRIDDAILYLLLLRVMTVERRANEDRQG